MNDRMGGSVRPDQELPNFEGFEERLLSELKTMVADRQPAVDPVGVPTPGRSPFRMPVRLRVGLVATAGLAAAGLFASGLIGGGSAPAVSQHVELTAFLNQAAAAARWQPVTLPKAGQVLVERVKTGQTGPKTTNKVRCFVLIYQTPATGRAGFPTKSGSCDGKLRPFFEDKTVDHPGKDGWTAIDMKRDPHARGYPDPARLPTHPAALLAALNRAAARGHWDTGSLNLAGEMLFTPDGPRSAIVFGLIERLLQVPIRPALRAALFEVTGRLPGITLERHATDLIGRPGVGIALSFPIPIIKGRPNRVGLEFVVDAKTYQFLGVAWTDGIGGKPAHPEKSGYAVIKSFLVTQKPAKH
jgi:hypothetical protein